MATPTTLSCTTVEDPQTALFSSALHTVCLSLAKQIVEDGEGIQHVVELAIGGALTDADALRVARSIAHSPLVKTAWAGCDPNWGRILAAIGYAGVAIDPSADQYSFWRARDLPGRLRLAAL